MCVARHTPAKWHGHLAHVHTLPNCPIRPSDTERASCLLNHPFRIRNCFPHKLLQLFLRHFQFKTQNSKFKIAFPIPPSPNALSHLAHVPTSPLRIENPLALPSHVYPRFAALKFGHSTESTSLSLFFALGFRRIAAYEFSRAFQGTDHNRKMSASRQRPLNPNRMSRLLAP